MKEVIKDVAVAAVIVFVAMQFYVPTRVFGISMEPSFKQNDYLVLSKEAYSKSTPKRGDVLVFQSNLKNYKGEKELLIKRVVGLPGDKIVIKDGEVYINGKQQPDYYTAERYTDGDLSITIPDGQYFCMGDNREHSTDSRYQDVGCVSLDQVKGKVVFRIYPFNKIGRIKGI